MGAGLTRRGTAVLFGSAALYGIGEWLGYPLARALGGCGVAVVAASIGLAARRLRVSAERTLDPERVHRGQSAKVTLTIRNGLARRQSGFVAIDQGDHAEPVAVPSLSPGHQVRRCYRLPANRRGRIPVGPLTIQRQDPMGLTNRHQVAGRPSELWVYPRLYPVRLTPGGHPRHHVEGPFIGTPLRGSMELRALREYTAGDEPRHIHWKATAATGELMVRDLVDPAEPRLAVLLDTRAGQLTADQFEEAVDFTASLLATAIGNGYRTHLRTSGGLDVHPRSGQSGLATMLDVLCAVRQSPPALTHGRDPEDDHLSPPSEGGAFVLVTGRSEAGAGWLARQRWRCSPVVIVDLAVAADPPSPPAATSPQAVLVIRGRDAAEATAAWNNWGSG